MYETILELLNVGGETRNIEFKKSYDWADPKHKAKIVKCILSMSNTKDGGYLVLGIDDNKTLQEEKLCGMDLEHYKKINYDDVVVQVNKFADPPISFQMHPVEEKGTNFWLFRIPEFEEIPIICKKNGDENLTEGAIFSRSKSKPESAIIRSQSEMRELINTAINKGIKEFYTRVRDSGLQITDDNSSSKYEAELDGIENNEIFSIIQKAGYWKITIKPTHYKENRINTLSECANRLYKNKLSLRGWDFPHISTLENGNRFVQTSEKFMHYNEFFRFFKSGQFVYYKAMYEESMEDYYQSKVNGKGLEIISTLLLFTEIFEFASRMFAQEDMGSHITVNIEAFDIKDRQLFFYDARALYTQYVSKLEDKIEIKKDMSIEQLITESSELAIKASNDFFEIFNLDTNTEIFNGVFKEEQEKLLSGRI
ncbi:helix-turn-helix domain-containing protein [Exiguobacterium sp. s80]|uniref:AlbA family DNA-binding domain-containing protein n=1 Tax=Exiguobacterium sp. s80 TaxID=2751209 RepID=UPI001BE8E5B0|nr:ATP-binding protein [Exiguobacterium sp. s80]